MYLWRESKRKQLQETQVTQSERTRRTLGPHLKMLVNATEGDI